MRRLSALAASGFSLLVSVTGAAAFELAHNNGTLHLESPPAHIVSYDLGVLDSLETLGIGEVVGVPKSVYQGRLARFNDAPVVGTLFEPDETALNQHKPDLIFSGSRSRAAMPQLQSIAPTVEYVTDPDAFLNSVRQNNLDLARAFGKEEEAQLQLDQIADNVASLQQLNQGKTGAFLFVIRENVIAHAPGDRFGYAYELSGLQSVLAASDAGNQPPASRPEPGSEAAKQAQRERAEIVRQVAQAEPDWLIVLDRGAINQGEKTAANTLAAHPDISQTQAFQQGNVYYADPNGWYVVTTGLDNLSQITADMLEKMK